MITWIMRTQLMLLLLMLLSFSASAFDKDCREEPSGLCVSLLTADNHYVNVWFDRELRVEILAVGYDLNSWRSWFLLRDKITPFSSFQVSHFADYNNDRNESVWFTAYKAKGAQCWVKSKSLYFYESWDGADRIKRPKKYSDSRAYDISVDEMVYRVNERYGFTDKSGKQITFCNSDIPVVMAN